MKVLHRSDRSRSDHRIRETVPLLRNPRMRASRGEGSEGQPDARRGEPSDLCRGSRPSQWRKPPIRRTAREPGRPRLRRGELRADGAAPRDLDRRTALSDRGGSRYDGPSGSRGSARSRVRRRALGCRRARSCIDRDGLYERRFASPQTCAACPAIPASGLSRGPGRHGNILGRADPGDASWGGTIRRDGRRAGSRASVATISTVSEVVERRGPCVNADSKLPDQVGAQLRPARRGDPRCCGGFG